MILVDLGAGVNKPAGFIGIDKFTRTDITGDITHGLPFRDGVVDILRARDVLEHIPPAHTIHVMNECWRVLVPGDGLLTVEVPRFPHVDSVKDPTHVSFWTVETFTEYFGGPSRLEFEYGFKMWDVLRLDHSERRLWVDLVPRR